MHWLSVGHTNNLHCSCLLVCSSVHSKCEWALWSLPCSDYLFNQVMVCFLTPSLLDHILSASYAFHAFLHTTIIVYCCVSGDSWSYDSKVSQLLVLGSIGRCQGWRMLWIIAKSNKLEKKKVRRNLVGVRSLEGLGTSSRLGLEGLLLFMYPNYIF